MINNDKYKMEWLVLLGLIGGGYYLYQQWSSPKKQTQQKVESADVYLKQAEEAYEYLSKHFEEILNEDIPKWVKEAKKSKADWKKHSPKSKVPDMLTFQPEKQEARKTEYEAEIEELERVRDKFLRVMMRIEYSKDMDLRLETIYDWNQWIVRKADANAWHGWPEGLYRDDAEEKAWKIKYEEIERRFDKKLKD